jgi:electron transfer flavoprotein alpha subunit
MSEDIYVIVEHLRGHVLDISYVMLAAARSLTDGNQGHAIAVLLGKDARHLAGDLAADWVVYVDHPLLADFNPDAYQRVLGELIRERSPRAVLFGDTSIGAELAGMLSVRIGLPLVSYCRSIQRVDGSLGYTSQICGGKIMVEGALPAPSTMVTMIPGGFNPEDGRSSQKPQVNAIEAPGLDEPRIRVKAYLEPNLSDVDISKEDVLIAVGRGVQNQDNIALAQELAGALGGVVCASRPVVDQDWLPTTRLVGKSGARVSPKLYLALGISGATEHVEAIADSETIVAINTDPSAPIFNIAQYGTTCDLFDLVPALTEQINAIRSS